MYRRAREWIARHFDKTFFFAIVVIGAISIVWVDAHSASKWIAVGICAALMVLYAASALILPGIKLRPDQSGDNLYYQGLLFTLTSLGVALYRFTGAGEADSILRNFGIAIFTTIIGLALRVLVSQFREDPEDIEQEARIALAQSVKRMRSELDLSVAELRSFADGMKLVVGEFTSSANKSTTQTLERAVGRFEKASEAMGTRLEATAVTFQERSGAFERALGSTIQALDGLTARVAAVRADETMIETALRPALSAIVAAAGEFGTSLNEQRESFEAGASAMRQFAETGPKLAEASSSLDSAVERLSDAAGQMNQAAGFVERLETASSAAAMSTETFSARLGELVTQAANQNADAIRTINEAAQSATAAATSQAERRLAALEEATVKFGRTLGDLEKEFSGSGETIQRVRQELTDLAGWIIARLERA